MIGHLSSHLEDCVYLQHADGDPPSTSIDPAIKMDTWDITVEENGL